MDKKGKKGNLVSVILTVLVIAIYLVPNFASAVSVKVMTDKLQYLPVDTQIVADVSIKINANERIPIKNLVLLANEKQVCVFNVDGSYLKENCPDAISITPTLGSYGQGKLEGTDEATGEYVQFGYGYGYGYGMDYGYTGNLSYHLIFNKSNTPPGIYKLKLAVNSVSHVFSGETTFEITEAVDSDGDGVADDVDNCPTTANADQKDTDDDGVGDACEIIACTTNAQCGTNIWTGSAACSGNNVYQDYTTYTCNNPGTVSSSCTSSTTNTLKENCNDGNVNTEDSCSNGVCSHQTIVCNTNADCNDGNPKTIDACLNAGTAQASCSHTTITCLTDADCNDANAYTFDMCLMSGTIDSSCYHETIKCLTNADCDDAIPSTQDSCLNAGTTASKCENKVVVACSTNLECNDNNPLTQDTCLNPGTQSSSCSHQSIACSTNANCGTSGYTGATTCIGNNVAQNYISYSCNNAGTADSSCSSSTSNQLKQTCYDANDYTADLCSNGNCYYPSIICSTNANCNDNNIHTQDTCLNAGTTSSRCENQQVKCLNDGECNDNNAYTKDTCLNAGTSTSSCSYSSIKCFTESVKKDCGENGFIESQYCTAELTLNKVYQKYRTYTCENSGQSTSSCKIIDTPTFFETCINGCENGKCIANTAPKITSTAITEAAEGTKYIYKVIAEDKEQTKLSFTDDSSLFNINSLNGEISFTPTKANLGTHTIKITISDGWLKDTQTFTLTISSVNNPPILTSIGALSAKEDELFTKTITATDKDGDALTYSDNSELFDISSEGIISFTPTKANIGAYTVTISVSDGKKTAEETLTFTVLAKETVNTVPVITDYTPLTNPTITELQQQIFTIQATDKESVPGIIWYKDNAVAGSGNSYTFIGDNSMGNSNAGVHAIKAIASDGELKAEHSWTLTVTRVKDTDSDGIPDASDNCVFVANANQLDSDSNGIGDACQGNIDGDAVADEEDFVEGTADNVDSNMQLNLDIGEENDTEKENVVTRVITGTQPVTFKTTEVDPVTQEVVTKPVVKFDFNFAEETKLDLSKIEITKQEETATAGEIIVKGIDLTAQNKTKTVYMDRKAGTDTICIKDAEIASIKEITSGCTGASEYLIACNSQKQGKYTCTIEGNKYKVEGLTHSGLIESTPNNAPSAVITTSSQSVVPNVPLQLAGYGTDPDGDNIVEYSWDLSSYDNKAQKIIFVTQNTYNGNLNGLAGADNICQEEADSANLLGTYKAWLSDSTTNAKDRLNIYNNYRLIDGTVIKENEALTYSPPGYIGGSPYELIKNPINKDAYGNNINDYVWTSTRYNGNIASSYYTYTCKDWTSSSNSDVSQVGSTNLKTNGWAVWMVKKCNEKFHLYCVQQTDINNGIIKQQSPSVSLTKPGTYSFKFIVKDERNAVGESTVQIRVLEKQNIALKQGWNLISLPLKPTDTSITSVLSSIQGKYDQVWAYQNGLWNVYDTARPVFLNTLNNIDESMGLYVKATEDTTLNVIGTTPSSTLISLKKGQNLIGYPSSVSRAAGDVLTTNYNSLLTLENGLWLVYDPARPPFLNTLTTIQPGKGYWVVVDNDAVWTFENGLYK